MRPSNNLRLQAILLSLPVLIYIFYRGYALSFTFDEAWTFLGYASSSWVSILSNEFPAANNHILHTLLMKLSSTVFGISPFALRIPIMITGILYVVLSFRISTLLFPAQWMWMFIAMVYQPYLMDYFVLARGYGLAITLTLAGIWFLARAEKDGVRNYWLAFGSFVMATYSNFTFFLIWPGLCAWACFRVWKMKTRVRDIGIPIISSLVALILISLVPLTRLIQLNELAYGGMNGFFADTLASLAGRILYSPNHAPLFGWVLLGVFVIASFVMLMRAPDKNVERGRFIPFLMLMIAASSILQHHLMGTPYLIDRTAIIFLPFLLMTVFLLIRMVVPKLQLAAAMVIAGLCIVNSVLAFNVDYTVDFREYADIDEAMSMIQKEREGTGQHIGKSKFLNAPINYYRNYYQMQDIPQVGIENCHENGPHDFYLIHDYDSSCVDGHNVELMRRFEVSKTHLYRTKK